MYSLSILTVFATAFVFVQCAHFYGLKHYDYNFHTEIGCQEVRQTVVGTMMNSTCKPHYRHVTLKAMPLQEYYPSVVSVRRCDGNCPGHTCVPIDIQMIKVPVKLTTRDYNGNPDVKCALVEVVEHIKCKCKCQHKEAECNDRQYYVKDRCACACKNQEFAKRECEGKVGMWWDDETCNCNCIQLNISCPTGSRWSRDECKCMSTSFKYTGDNRNP